MHWRIEPEWQGQAAFIVGGGTSVRNQNLNLLRGRRVIAVNSSYEAVPWADILYFADKRWMFEHMKRPAFRAFPGRKVTCSNWAGCDSNFLRLRRVVPNFDPKFAKVGPGIALDPCAVVSNRTSLQGAMNIAVHLGANPLVLLGADMRRADDGGTHHHKPHIWNNKPGNESWVPQLEQLALTVAPLQERGIEVINTSPISLLPWWPKESLEAVCARLSIASCEPAESTGANTLSDSESRLSIAI